MIQRILAISTLYFMIAIPCSFAQVHQEGTAGIDMSISRTGAGLLGAASYLKNISDVAFLKVRGLGEFGRLYNFRYSQFGVDLLTYYSPLYLSDFIQLNIGGGLTASYENVKGISKEKAAGIGFMAGVKGSLELEAFLSDQLAFFTYGNQAFMLKKSLGNTYSEIGIGIRIFLNNYY